MNYTLRPIQQDDGPPIMDIFNYYIENSFAAYPEQKLPYLFFTNLLKSCEGYPSATVRDKADRVIGFGMLRPYNPFPTFAPTSEITYFLKPETTGQGIGRNLLHYLVTSGRKQGICSVVATISSLNKGSIRFHTRNGFKECGRLKRAGVKKGQPFDVLYFQKEIDPAPDQ